MKTALVIAFALSTYTAAFAAEGKIIPRAELPASVAKTAKKEPKFPGIPACARGRLETSTWPESVSQDKHPCKDAQNIYVCQAFGKISVRCE